MARGIALTAARRSQLLQELLRQGAVQDNPQTAIEAALRVGADAVRAKTARKLQEQESASQKRRGAQEAAALAELMGDPVRSVFGTELPDSGGKGAQLANLLKNSPDSDIGRLIAGKQVEQAFAPPPNTPPGFTLGQGQKRFDAAGNEIAAVDPKPEKPVEPPKPTAREARIKDLMDTLGFTRQQAVAEVDKLIDFKITTEGRALLTDTTDPNSPSVQEVPISGNALTVPEFNSGETLFGLAAAATGPGNIIAGKFAPLGAAFGLPESVLPTDAVSSQQFFKAAENSVIRGFSLNPRFPVAEQNRIKENINIGPKFFDSPELMQQRMFAVDTFLKNEEAKFLADASDPGLANDTRRKQAANAVNVKSFRNGLGVTPDIRQLVETEGLTPAEAFELIQLRKEQGGG